MNQTDFNVEIHKGMSFEDYLAIDAINASTLKAFAVSGKAGAWYVKNGRSETGAMNRGTAFHKVCEDGHFDNIIEHTASKSVTTKAFREEQDALPPGKILMLADERERLIAMYEAFKSHPVCKKALSEASVAEHVIVWTDPLLGYKRCKCRIDRLWEGIGAVDIKTIATMSIHDIEASIARYKYHLQVAFYCRAIQVAYKIKRPAWLFAWQESSPPFDSCVSGMPDDDIAQGWAEVEIAMHRLRDWVCNDKADGIAPDNRLTLGLPRWAQNENLQPINNPF